MRVGGTDTPARTRVTVTRLTTRPTATASPAPQTAACRFTQYWRAPLLQRSQRRSRAPPPSPRHRPNQFPLRKTEFHLIRSFRKQKYQ